MDSTHVLILNFTHLFISCVNGVVGYIATEICKVEEMVFNY